MTDYLIAGLGNPGTDHANQRHNVGFWCMNRLAKRHGIEFKNSRLASTATGRIGEAEVLLMKPRTYVNRSGDAIGPALKRERVPLSNLVVVYDELDLPVGRIRLRPDGGAGGHNGLKSIIATTGSGAFGRVRVGIGRPLDRGVPSWDPEVVMRHVLGVPSKEAREVLDAAVERVCEAIESIIEIGFERAMNKYNTPEP